MYAFVHSAIIPLPSLRTPPAIAPIRSAPMSEPTELAWITAGYATFAERGPEALKVEQLARQVGISKSSFYHHFADIPSFIDRLLNYHLERAEHLGDRTRACATFDPEFLHVLLDSKPDLVFNRQLRNQRENLSYQLCYQRAHTFVEHAVVGIWAEALGIPGRTELARNLFTVVADLFYQRFKKDELTYEWLQEFLLEVHGFMGDAVRRSGIQAAP